MALRTSLVLSGDATGAKEALDQTNAALGRAQKEAQQLAEAYSQADVATSRLAKAQATARTETEKAKQAFAAGETTVEEYNRQLLETKAALQLVAAEQQKAIGNLRQSQAAFDAAASGTSRHSRSLGEAKAGYINLGRQVQDVAIQMQSGTNLGTIIAQQGGQIADAVAMMGGKFSGLASFLGGPWGAAITVAVGVLVNLATAMFDAGKETEAASSKTYDFSKRLNTLKLDADEVAAAMGQLAQQTRSAIPEAGTFVSRMAENAAKAVSDLEKRVAAKQREITGLESRAQYALAAPGGLGVPVAAKIAYDISKAKAELAGLKRALDDAKVASGNTEIASLQSQVINAMDASTAATSRYNEALGKLNERRQQSIKLDRELAKAEPHYAAAVRARNNYISAADFQSEMARIRAERDVAVEAARKSGRSSSGSGLSGREITMAEAKAIAQRAGWQVNSGTRPTWMKDEVPGGASSQERLYNQWIAQGRPANNPTAAPGHSAHERANALDIQFGSGITPATIRKAYADEGVRLTKLLKERGHFHIEWSTSGADKVEREAVKLADDTAKLFTDAQNGADAVFYKAMSTGDVYDRIGVSIGQDLTAAMDDLTKASDDNFKAWQRTQAETAATLDNIVGMVNAMDKLGGVGSTLGNIGALVVGMTSGNFSGVNGKLGALFDLSPELRGLGVEIGQQLDRVFGGNGAFAKTMASLLQSAGMGVAGATLVLGQKGNNVGAAVGGVLGQSLGQAVGPAIGKAIGGSLGKALGSAAGPLGSIVGGVLGGLVGSIFGKKPKGSSSVTQDGVNTSANDGQVTSSLNSMGGQLQSAIAQIASKLGGQVGSYDVGFGQYKDYFQVSGSGSDRYLGQTYYNQKSGQALYDGKDAGAALSAAIANAISDGAIKGVSAAVQKALKSSKDVDKAITEALKVQQVEMAIGGLGAELEKAFRDFEAQANERLRIAKQYGFDVVKMEQRNAEDRLKLTKDLMAQQIGSLQQLIDDMTSGSLFEGTALEQRKALLDQIAATKVEADAGTAGAADKLAKLLEQLNSVSRDAYGTTGGFAADRTAILDQARDTIAKANQRIADAQAAASDPALTTTNAALDENNAQNAQVISQLGVVNAQLAALIAQGGVVDLGGLAAMAKTG